MEAKEGEIEVTTRPDENGTGVIQSYGSLVPVRLGLAVQTRYQSVAGLNRLLAHSMAMRDLLGLMRLLPPRDRNSPSSPCAATGKSDDCHDSLASIDHSHEGHIH